MMEFNVSFEDNNTLKAAVSYPEYFAKELYAGMVEAGALLERRVKQLAPTGTGGSSGYRGSIAAITPYLTDGSTLVGGVGTSCAYAIPVELGTRPHFPPVAPLIDWVKDKLGERDNAKAKSIAFCIARKIARHGTKGQHIFARAMEASTEDLTNIFNKAAERTLEANA